MNTEPTNGERSNIMDKESLARELCEALECDLVELPKVLEEVVEHLKKGRERRISSND